MKWPFRRKPERGSPAFWIARSYLGIVKRPDGSLEISLTKDESETVQRHLDMLNAFAKEQSGGAEVLVHPEAAKVLEAQGLWLHAHHILLRSQFDGSAVIGKAIGEEDSVRAIAAQTKAYTLCHFPIILVDIARVFKLSGNHELEVRLNREFCERDEQFQYTELYGMFLEWRTGILARLDEQ